MIPLYAWTKILIRQGRQKRTRSGLWSRRPLALWESYSHRLSPDQGIIFSFFFILFFIFFPVSYHSPIMWNCHFHFFHSPIMWKCHSHLFIVFPSCAVNIIMCILVPSRLVDTQRKTSKSKTQKLRPQPQFLWGRNSRLLQVRIRLTLVN